MNGKKAGDTFDPDLPGMPDYGAAKNVLNNPEMNATLAPNETFQGSHLRKVLMLSICLAPRMKVF